MSPAREEILARLRAARNRRGEPAAIKPGFTSSVYLPLNSDRTEEFRIKLEAVGGKLFKKSNLPEAIQTVKKFSEENQWEHIFCLDPTLQPFLRNELKVSEDLKNIEKMQVGITRCEFLIAHLGAVLISSGQPSGRKMNVFPEIHIIFAHKQQLADYLENGLDELANKYNGQFPSLVSVITGPSRTADIEKTLVMGMHGPRSLLVFICDEPF